jgi:predicted nucleic acid-binding protein
VVTNTTPLIALSVATGSLDDLRVLYDRVVVPHEVAQEVLAGSHDAETLDAFQRATWLERSAVPVAISTYLENSLDRGEASVIQTALNEGIELVCIDEAVGRRIARLSGLTLTGSIGVLLKARQKGYMLSIPDAINRMRQRGIWLSDSVVRFAMMHEE